jgi:uncharacterized protein (DUF2235 family)
MKRLVVCCDGTWNFPDQKNGMEICPSNVAKMARSVASSDASGNVQQIFYRKGVGTNPGERLRGGAFGWGLSKAILDAYRFLIEEYEPDDEIFLFGFSRGAYTARSTVGLIRNSGLLRRSNLDQIDEAYSLYRRKDDAAHPNSFAAELFRKQFAHQPRIKFVGVWDTVGALGIPVGIPWLPESWLHAFNQHWEFHDVKLSSIVENAYQAVAIDERRPQFQPTLWEQQDHAVVQGQVMEQVWFVGVHSDIGGGYPDSHLADITFLWLKEKAESCGLAFDQDYIQTKFAPDPCGALHDSKTGPYRLFRDAVRPIGAALNGNEAVHRSAEVRVQQSLDPVYNPPNLMRYLQQGGPVTS